MSHSSCEIAALVLFEELPEPGQLGRTETPYRALRRVKLEGAAYVVPFLERVRGDRRHVVAAPSLHGEETLGDETRERVVHRAARNPELGRQLVQAQLLSRPRRTGQDAAPQRLVDLLVQVRPRQRRRHTQM